MLDAHAHWPSGIRDTTEFPRVDITIDTSFREHLAAFLKLDGIGWNDYSDQREISGQAVADSRMRTNRKMYERMGVIYKDNDKIRLSRLGLQMKNLEHDLNEEKERILSGVRTTAVDILSRYQLKNPVDGPDLPLSCDVLPCVCIWKAMRELDNKICYEEMNRVILHVMEMSQLDEAIQIIRDARRRCDRYSALDEATLNTILGNPVHTDQPTARIAPWFSFAGWGGLVIEQNADDNGFRYLVEETLPQVDAILDKPYPHFETDDKDEWLKYYIGSAADISEDAAGHTDSANSAKQEIDESTRLTTGENVLLYGVPGSGKSWTIEHEYCTPDTIVERLVFHPDYTNADFVGQILPVVDPVDKQVTYEFTPGPFTNIIRDAYTHPQLPYVLVIEEINRGNAPAIFGDVFQLLDRSYSEKTDGSVTYPVGTSEYGITNGNVAKVVYGDETHKVRIPSNLSILGTMNTSDQNVFTLDTAFQRRWRMRLIENNFFNVRTSLAQAEILDTGVTWRRFCETVNEIIIGNKAKMASAEDKRLGVYFVHENDLKFDDRAAAKPPHTNFASEYNELLKAEIMNGTPEEAARLAEVREALMQIRIFPEKVIKYLWDDAFKFNPEALFDTDNMDSLEKVIRTFVLSQGHDRFKIFRSSVQQKLYPTQQ